MAEKSIIENTPEPRTRMNLAEDLCKLGLASGMTVIVHSSMSSIGWVCGGPVAVVQALMDVITPQGTIVMPAQTTHYSDPACWENPPVPTAWHEKIRKEMPAFESEITPTLGMGVIAETFRTFPSVYRSNHPAYSFAAWGKDAEAITHSHSLDNGLGERSPLARIYEKDGWILMLGTGYNTNTSFHLAEYRSGVRKAIQAGAPIIENGKRVWSTYHDIALDEECFQEIGDEMEKVIPVKRGKAGSARSYLFRQREAVDFAKAWLIRSCSK
ncbi:aminoglycoside 3-N-acetyltransferase [Scopulibacillus daqui]|uniref:Aminoglycoside N(3)-acetyltransferase n=1 Tax=Scopulibacillus daqui TaxID=1469162 RepID=A0ABS2PVU5_9BACL|nr:AAC(3) family N-acetyltransferase [Scopulibacillus daqui]MBM7644172.1 aminoglycoside 3-N-acetyltransferase [Scopulibacillus daqui]